MNIKRYFVFGLLYRQVQRYIRSNSVTTIQNKSPIEILCKYLNITEARANFLCLKQPVVMKMNDARIKILINTINEMGFPTETLLEEPALFGVLPITLKFRHKVLNECGIKNVTIEHVAKYLPIMKQETIGELRKSGLIPPYLNVENQIAQYMTQWPTSLTTLIYDDVNDTTLFNLRLKIIQRYLELVLDLSKEEFYRGIETYPTIKHRPLEYINETLNILKSKIMLPDNKIKSNLYLVHVDPDNLKNIIHKFWSIGGIDIKEVIRLHPKLATRNYNTLVETKKVLEEFGITDEAQRRCFAIYTLSPETIRERLEKAKHTPEFNTLLNHPRFLQMIYYNTTATKRLLSLYSFNKKCVSLNVLSGSEEHYEAFEKAPGDRLGKGKDLFFCISQLLEKQYSTAQICNAVKRHPFWMNTPVFQIKYIYEKLSTQYSKDEIYENCTILLYPWKKVRETLYLINKKQIHLQFPQFTEHFNYDILNKSQILSLALYLMEKSHYFSGNGIWCDDKNKRVGKIAQEYEKNSS